jgi:ribosome-binding factor A
VGANHWTSGERTGARVPAGEGLMSGRRAERVGEAIREVIAGMLLREIKDPRIGMVTLTTVQLTDDLRHAKVYFSCVGDAAARDRSLNGLRSATGFIRAQLTRRLQLRVAPELTFLFDPTLANAERLASLLAHTNSQG